MTLRLLSILALVAASAVQAQMPPEQIKPIVEMTKSSWVAVSVHMGQDLLYFTHLETWRCGIEAVHYGINGAAAETAYPILPCDPENPNAIPADHLPYLPFDANLIEEVTVSVTYMDGAVSEMSYARSEIGI